jgi:hypothetical protein
LEIADVSEQYTGGKLIFDPENGGDISLRIVYLCPNLIALQHRRLHYIVTAARELEFNNIFQNVVTCPFVYSSSCVSTVSPVL